LTSITSFSLGLSYSLSHADVIAFLGNLPALANLRLTYYYVRPSFPPILYAS
jgi:hypothetical protein